MAKAPKGRIRADADDIRNAAQSGGTAGFFKLPADVTIWRPEKADSYQIDFLPYLTTDPNHPDKVAVNTGWWRRRINVLRNIGPNNERLVSPSSVGKPCPVTEEWLRLRKNYDDNEEQIKAIKPQQWSVFPIKDPNDKKGQRIALFVMPSFCFGDVLDDELKSAKPGNLRFYETDDTGRTLTLRFKDTSFATKDGTAKFLKCDRIDFEPRAAMDDDAIMAAVPKIDDILNVMEYQQIKRMFLQIDDSKTVKDDTGGDDEAPPKGKAAEAKDDDNDAPSTKKSADKAPTWKEGDRVQFTDDDDNTIIGKITDIDGADATVEDDKGDDHDTLLLTLSAAPAAEEKDDDDDEKKSADDDDEAPTGKAGTPKKGDTVTFINTKGKELTGIIIGVDTDGDVTIKSGDKEYVKDISEVKISGGAAAKDDDDEAPATPAFKEGDSVTWDKGDESGVYIKTHSDGTKVRIKDDDGGALVWVAISEVKLKKKAK